MSFLAIQSKKKKAAAKESSSPEINVPDDEILLSDKAAQHVRQLLAAEKPNGVFRVGVVGGGCSGFSYHFAIEDSAGPKDKVFEKDGVRYCIDLKSLKLLGGSVVDWFEQPGRRGFRLLNSKGTKNCSCGESFSF